MNYDNTCQISVIFFQCYLIFTQNKSKKIVVNLKIINKMRDTHDIVLIANDLQDLQGLLDKAALTSKECGVSIIIRDN